MKKFTSKSVEETKNIAQELAASLKGGDIVTLHGDLGAGKTTFSKGLLSFFGIDEHTVVSPTFTLIQQYNLHLPTLGINHLVHVDTYRTESAEECIDIGLEDYLDDASTLCIIEWPEKITSLLSERDTIIISIAHKDEHTREISIQKNSD